jgi:WD40 repeat protein
VDWWLRNRSASHLLIVWTDGELSWDRAAQDFDWSRTTALPRRLQKAFPEEPNYLDLRFAKHSEHLVLRHPEFRDAVARLSATLQGRSLDDMIGEDIQQHEKMLRLARYSAIGLVTLVLGAVVAAFLAKQARDIAVGERKVRVDVENQEQGTKMSREVAEQARALLASDHDLAILLAAEAAGRYPTPEAQSVLRESLFEQLAPKLTLAGHAGGTYVAQFTPDGQRVITGGADKMARVWESDSGKMIIELHGHTDGVTGLDVGSDGKRILTSSQYDHSARLWDAASGRSLVEIKQDRLAFALLSPNAKQILAVAEEGDAVLWDAGSGERLRKLTSPYAQMRNASQVYSARFSPDGNRVAMVDWQPVVCEVATGKTVLQLEGHTSQVRDIAYSPDGQWLVTASEDHTARVWLSGMTKSTAVLAHDAEVTFAMYSPDGRSIITGTSDHVLHVWDATTRVKLSDIDVQPNQLAEFALSPDGNFLVAALEEHTARVFETRTGATVAELTGHTGPVRSPAFSPLDSRRIVTADLDGKVNVYAFDLGGTTAQLVAMAHQRVPRQLTAQERERYLPAGLR